MEDFFKDKLFSYQVLRVLGETVSGSADIGEVISTVKRIKDGDYESWCKEWSDTAERLRHLADEWYKEGFSVSASEAYLRASNYYRTAEFFLHEKGDNPTDTALYELSLQCFSYSIKLNGSFVEEVKIPYEHTLLPGYFYHSNSIKGKKATLIAMTGYDSTKEEMNGLAIAALKRGMNCLTFEGPGQGEVIRRQKLTFRYDYEQVITPVMDYLISREDVDERKIVLLGESFGGYLAPRAAAFEHRLAACVANVGIYDFQGFRRPIDVPRAGIFKAAMEYPEEINRLMNETMNQDSGVKWAITHGMYVFGAASPAEWIVKCEPYYLKGIAEKIKCPTLIIDSENEQFFPAQAKPLFEELTCEKKLMIFKTDEGAGEHCQVGAKLLSHERIFNWIEKVLY